MRVERVKEENLRWVNDVRHFSSVPSIILKGKARYSHPCATVGNRIGTRTSRIPKQRLMIESSKVVYAEAI
jgi:hypothetical protein